MLPSAFVMRLRKFLRTRRLLDFKQLGADRVIDFIFQTGSSVTHLIIELYVSGNVLLTDEDYKILSILRPHSNVEAAGRLAQGETYPVHLCYSNSLLVRDPILLTLAFEDTEKDVVLKCISHHLKERLTFSGKTKEMQTKSTSSEKQKKGFNLKQAISYLLPFAHSSLISHGILMLEKKQGSTANVNESFKKCYTSITNESDIQECLLYIVIILKECFDKLISVSVSDNFFGHEINENQWRNLFPSCEFQSKGFILSEIISSPLTNDEQKDETASLQTFEKESFLEFSPIFLEQYATAESTKKLHVFSFFPTCLDHFFSHDELEKQDKAKKQLKDQHYSKAEKILSDQQRRIDALTKQQEDSIRYAGLLEKNAVAADQCLTMIQAALSTGVSWRELKHHVELEKKKEHPLASLIHQMDFENNTLTLLLSSCDEADLLSDTFVIPVPVDIRLSLYQNITELHQNRKQMLAKVERTQHAVVVAVEAANRGAEKKSKNEMLVGSKTRISNGLCRLRKTFWFEKFNWFITSEGFLVIAGRDATQNDMLYKRYLEKNDIFVHADAHGSPACIIKNPQNKTIPLLALQEAGRMSVCRSSCWKTKLMTRSWWVYPFQVSKTAPTGEYIMSGSFIIRGKKNMLPPEKLEMGLGILFVLGEDLLSEGVKDWDTPVNDNKNENPLRFHIELQLPSQVHQHEIIKELEKEDEALKLQQEEQYKKRQEKNEKRSLHCKASVESCQERKQCDTLQKEPISSVCPTLIRGKKSKLKRVKEKYNDQEPEERDLRMKLLGSKPMKEFSKCSLEENCSTTIQTKDCHTTLITTSGSRHQNIPATVSNAPLPLASSVPMLTCELQRFTKQPQEYFTLVCAVPVCAPWTTLQSYKYKVKLVPGHLKKGQAGTQILRHFVTQTTSGVEKELIRCIPLNDMNQALSSNVRIVY
ncbi:ribosome quality control complex subunit NEMF-like isoform X2 [Hylaeus volcanicus]|nr:ribosome quality control complex subunit NEMF-like isoform X2 [Hylaeus volcanicus]